MQYNGIELRDILLDMAKHCHLAPVKQGMNVIEELHNKIILLEDENKQLKEKLKEKENGI